MALFLCQDCNAEVSNLAVSCPKCGSPNVPQICQECGAMFSRKALACSKCGHPAVSPIPIVETNDSHWMPVFTLVIGIIFFMGVLGSLDGSPWDQDAAGGFLTFVSAGLFFGVVSLKRQKYGRKMCVIGLILLVISLLCAAKGIMNGIPTWKM